MCDIIVVSLFLPYVIASDLLHTPLWLYGHAAAAASLHARWSSGRIELLFFLALLTSFVPTYDSQEVY